MSVLRIKAYHSTQAIKNGMGYVTNTEKTRLSGSNMDIDASYKGDNGYPDNDLDLNTLHAFTYSTNSAKTNIGVDGDIDLLVSGINCKPDTAVYQFVDDMNQYYALGHKEDLAPRKAKRLMRIKYDEDGTPITDEGGNMLYFEDGEIWKDPDTGKCVYQEYMQTPLPRTCYMWVLSFPPKEVLGYDIDPRLVHQIGIEFCEKYLSEYRCTVSTHMDRAHIHNHIMQCAYTMSPVNCHKYKDNKDTLAQARDIADELSRKYGLPIILEPQTGKGVSWFEWKARKQGQSWKNQMRQDIRDTIAIANSYEEFKKIMKQSGYSIRETESHITYTLPGDDKCVCRDTMLNKGSGKGEDYTKKAIIKFFERKELNRVDIRDKGISYQEHIDIVDPEHKEANNSKASIRVSRYTELGRRRSDLEILLIAAIKIIRRIADKFAQKDENKIPQKDNPIYKPASWKIQQMQDTLQMVQTLGIQEMKDLDNMLNDIGIRLSQAKKQMNDLSGSAKIASDLIKKIQDADDIISYLQEMGFTVDDLQFYTYSDEEIRHRAAELYPMSDEQRKTLYIELDKASFYKTKYKFEDITRDEAQEAIDFLKGRVNECPAVLIDLADDTEERLIHRYEKIAEGRINGMKNKYGDMPMTKAQENKIESLFSGKEEADTDKLYKHRNVELDTSALSYYDAFRIINYLSPHIPLSSPVAEKDEISTVLKLISENGDRINRNASFVTIEDINQIKKYYSSGKRTSVPDILKESKPASEAEIKQCHELLNLRKQSISVPVEELSHLDARNLCTALLLHGQVPEVLQDLGRDEKIIKDEIFEDFLSKLSFEKQQGLIQARDIMNELILSGINMKEANRYRTFFNKAINDYQLCKENFEEYRNEYKNLSRIKYNINLALKRQYIYGPLYDDKVNRIIEVDHMDGDKEFDKKQQVDLRSIGNARYSTTDLYFERTFDIEK